MSIYFTEKFERSFGTFPLKGDELKKSIFAALEVGYRAFDTAQMYQNESETGDALKEASIAREDICVTTKVMHQNYAAEDFIPSVQLSLRDLKLDYVDVLLLHWPPPDFNIVPCLEQLAEAQQKGYARHIGVSNFTADMLRQSVSVLDTPIVTNQVEFHPLLNQDILLSAAAETGIPLAAYCSVARGQINNHDLLNEIGNAYAKSAAQITQRWILQKGVSVNTMSRNPANIAANYNIMDFTLSSTDMARIDFLTKTNYRIVDKALVPWAPDFD